MMHQDGCTPIIVGGDFNISFDTDEFKDVLQVVLGQPTFVIANGERTPTGGKGTKILDYFFIDNVSGFYDDLSTQTFTGCIQGYEIEKHHVVLEYFLEEFIVSTFNTELEAQTYINNQEYLNSPVYQNIAGRANFDEKKVSFSTRRETTFYCTKTFQNPSDHNPIQTCFSYDCQGQVDCHDTPRGDECIDSCLPGFKCVNGHCIPL